jgi:hypothetical protein
MSESSVQRKRETPPWMGYTNDEEKQRLSVINDRLGRKTETVRELEAERHKIMNRCIRRMRRSEGKR